MGIITKFFSFLGINNQVKENEDGNENEAEKANIEPREFDVDEFNNWFKTEYSGYGGQKGAPGIFLRLDKLSDYCIAEYLRFIGQDDSYENTIKHRDIIRKDWMNKLRK